MSIGIIGYGSLGRAVHNLFPDAYLRDNARLGLSSEDHPL